MIAATSCVVFREANIRNVDEDHKHVWYLHYVRSMSDGSTTSQGILIMLFHVRCINAKPIQARKTNKIPVYTAAKLASASSKDLCIVCKYHKDVINLEEVEKRYKDQLYKIDRYSLGFTKGTKPSTMDTRLNAKSSTEILRRLRKGVRLSLEQENRRVADENVVLWTKFNDASTCRTCTLNVGIRVVQCSLWCVLIVPLMTPFYVFGNTSDVNSHNDLIRVKDAHVQEKDRLFSVMKEDTFLKPYHSQSNFNTFKDINYRIIMYTVYLIPKL
ncbi:hypothetical protein C5167_013390 [Papaver somniferum]|uniref:Uncharacterized protein n=1 Tax=Papaver somniferum TaxID=3469 RepID=A0A4Y7J255_PAPSO|nr:hypothetical protein C5167_013390 [Papaver somniferum]